MWKKTVFSRALADWIELTPQTVSALTTTLCAHAVLIDDLLRLISTEAYQYMITAILQIDPVEQRFSQYK